MLQVIAFFPFAILKPQNTKIDDGSWNGDVLKFEHVKIQRMFAVFGFGSLKNGIFITNASVYLFP